MPKAVWEKVQQEAEEVAQKADARADSLLTKAIGSKWTWAIVLAAVVLLVVLF